MAAANDIDELINDTSDQNKSSLFLFILYSFHSMLYEEGYLDSLVREIEVKLLDVITAA